MYLWIKALHIIAVTCWFAALFYLPRLFVYHSMSEDEASKERFKIMERKLYRGIMTPSAVIAIALGGYLIAMNPQFYLQSTWMQVKLFCVALLIIYHFMCGHFLKQFRDAINSRSHVFYRWFNEFPVLLLIAIVILVVVRPF
jgi:protoporphyrinogen IX oxidase